MRTEDALAAGAHIWWLAWVGIDRQTISCTWMCNNIIGIRDSMPCEQFNIMFVIWRSGQLHRVASLSEWDDCANADNATLCYFVNTIAPWGVGVTDSRLTKWLFLARYFRLRACKDIAKWWIISTLFCLTALSCKHFYYAEYLLRTIHVLHRLRWRTWIVRNNCSPLY